MFPLKNKNGLITEGLFGDIYIYIYIRFSVTQKCFCFLVATNVEQNNTYKSRVKYDIQCKSYLNRAVEVLYDILFAMLIGKTITNFTPWNTPK